MAALSDDEVQAASKKAFAALPDLSGSISELAKLKGVGPATASAVVAAHAPSVAPFMSDEVRKKSTPPGSAIFETEVLTLRCNL